MVNLVRALAVGLLAAVMGGCGGAEKSAEAPKPEPSHVETADCRTSTTALLDDAEAAAEQTEASQVLRYAEAIAATIENDLGCSADVLRGVIDVVTELESFHEALAECELRGQWFSLRDDGQPDEAGPCVEADRPFADAKASIVETRKLVDLVR
ncbi:hypothetical protein KVF89_22350 [Nocardioides carbamazepini]|uniref:hypothetical protein n=1 Tax=Nocardioides carbamazepini TaxID=2854259 RepID=UPI002149BE03|nr:hypothetical protein [Nocardioides carbamazepini]MCR1785298.1 hypothetical protein [Nocardioides carbamazepini]